jgi:hypothetical protein
MIRLRPRPTLPAAPRESVKVGHGYYFGASSRPSFALVLSVTDTTVRYCVPYVLQVRQEQRAIFELLATSGRKTVSGDAEQWAKAAQTADDSTSEGRLTKHMAAAHAARLAAHGAPVAFADYDRVSCRVSAPAGRDVYGLASQWGVVGEWEREANCITVECDRSTIPSLVECGLTVASAEVVRACPGELAK